jgi:ATP-dependent Lhr-like helicase
MPFEIFSPKMQRLIGDRGFVEATLPQKLGIPEIVKGSDVLIIAPTGIGKTESAILPLFDRVHEKKEKAISILYINPLRSLSRDLLDRLFWWADKLDMDVSVRHGDTSQQERKMQSQTPPDCLITTPETLSSILIGKKIREHLKNVKYVVVDEIHELAGSKRGIQLSLLLERLRNIAGNFQRIGLSATVGSPEKISRFIGPKTKIINADHVKHYDIRIETPLPDDFERALMERMFMSESTLAKVIRIRNLLEKHTSVLTFTNTRQTAEVLSSRLLLLERELKKEKIGIDVHHGSLSKELRIKSESRFKRQELKGLVCTSSLELGIDIGSIDLVVQYLSPRQATKLIQRIGRSGHTIGKKSNGIIITGEEDVFESAMVAKAARERLFEEIKIHDLALDVLAVQIVGMALEEYGISSDSIYETVIRAYPYRNLKKDKFMEIVTFLGKLGLLWLEPVYDREKHIASYKIMRKKRGWKYYYENLSMIPDTRQVRVISIVEGEPIGMLDEAFVAEYCESGKTFIVNGRAWRVLQYEENRLMVEPVDDIESAIPAWEGELIPVPAEIANSVGNLRTYIKKNENSGNLIENLENEYGVDENSAREMIGIIKSQKTVPDSENFLLENYKDFIILHTCAGTMINNTLSKHIANELTSSIGVAVNVKTDPYRIMIQTLAKPEQVMKALKIVPDLKKSLEFTIENSTLFKWRFLQVAKRFGVIMRGAKFDKIGISKIISQYISTPVYEEALREVFLDKLDLENTERILDNINNNKIKINVSDRLTKLGELGLTHHFSEVIKPDRPEKEIFMAFRRRLMHTQLRLVCTNCANYSILMRVKDIEQQPTCPKCSSGLIGLCSKFKKKPLELLNKAKRKKKLAEDEKKDLVNIKRSASLMITYGKKYTMTYAGRGIGPETAARILARLPEDEEQLLKYIYEAEKLFIKNKIYWNR